jgi:CubicO group peptidase (beta-lactamase class C family)
MTSESDRLPTVRARRRSMRFARAAFVVALLLPAAGTAAPARHVASKPDPAAMRHDTPSRTEAASMLHDDIAASLQAQALTGAVWSTVGPDGTIATDAAGVRDTRTGAALRADDRVHVGSVAKTLLATGVLRLVTEGRLALDTPVATLLPGLAFANPWEATHPLRVRHLLDHTAGLDDARLAQVFSLRADADAPLSAAFAGHGPLRVRSRPGARHSYSNTGYTLLGMIVEAVTGTRYETYLDAHLLRPLEMRDSTFAYTTQHGSGADPRLATGHFERGAPHAAVPQFLRPAGQFTTTAADMGRFARFLLGDGTLDGTPFIDRALLRAMGEPVATEAADAGLRVGYGLGLSTRDRHGAVGRCHGGSTVGYRAMFCVFPEAGRAFFVAVNADVEGADYGAVDRRLIAALRLPPAASPSTATTAPVDVAAWSGWYVPAPNRFASFAWLDTVFGAVRVDAEGAGVRFAPLQAPAQVLMPAGGGLFRAADRTTASHALLVAADGTRVIGTGLQSYERIALPKLGALWLSAVAGALGAVWLLLAGGFRAAFHRGDGWRHPTFLPFVGLLALAAPVPLFLRQSFLQLGDPTPASLLLAGVTALLPLTMLAGLVLAARRRAGSALAIVDTASMLAVLQWAGVLAWWGLLPTRLWS